MIRHDMVVVTHACTGKPTQTHSYIKHVCIL